MFVSALERALIPAPRNEGRDPPLLRVFSIFHPHPTACRVHGNCEALFRGSKRALSECGAFLCRASMKFPKQGQGTRPYVIAARRRPNGALRKPRSQIDNCYSGHTNIPEAAYSHRYPHTRGRGLAESQGLIDLPNSMMIASKCNVNVPRPWLVRGTTRFNKGEVISPGESVGGQAQS
ncbi:hypothetical protein J6590_023681 [Homalodisca vitripennis]|nr:hypothetical protein J6590_023681 [Homalodisca vitripennis]